MPRKSQSPSVADGNAAPGGVAAVDRALSLLGAFRAGDNGLGLAELAARTRLHKSTALRLLASLEHAGWVQRGEGGQYLLGTEVARLHGLHAAAFSLEALVMPVLRALADATQESAAFHVRRNQGAGWVRLCQFRVDSPQVLRDHVKAGDLLPTDRGAGARVLVAFSPDLARAAGRRERALYADIRAKGFCAIVGDRSPELGGVSAPVFDRTGALLGAITLTMPAHRYREAQIAPVRAAAAQLAALL